jgi:two-component system NtrC family response regulator
MAHHGYRLLIVDDDASVTASLELLFKQAGYATRCAAMPDEALRLVEAEAFSAVVQDLNFSRRTTGEEGLGLLRDIKTKRPELPVVLLTAWGSIALAVEGMKAGAADFVTKPWVNQHLLQAVETAIGLAQPGRNGAAEPRSREAIEAEFDFHGTVGHHPRLLRVLELASRVAPTEASVLITGESGTGKEAIADAIHRNSRRRNGPFLKVNLGGISSSLFESEMFGHVRGAFTDARQDRKGRFEAASGGTIFLDEIGELDPSSQVKLLRVLQDRTYEVLGSSVPRSVDVRVISATNRNLAEMVARGEFREDLLYRLNLITIQMPPLRERRGDIGELSRYFLDSLARAYARPDLKIDESVFRWLSLLEWPGNIRQLKQLIERTVLISRHDLLTMDDFSLALGMEQPEPGQGDALPAPGSMTIEAVEKAMILKCMAQYDGNISRVAEALGLSRPALYRRLEKYGIAS